MRPSGKPKSIDIDNTHSLFKGTPYENESFALTFDLGFEATVRNSIKSSIAVSKVMSEEEKASNPTLYNGLVNAYSQGKYFFIAGITDWTGFEDINGNELECTDANKESYVDDVGYNDFFEIVSKIVAEARKPSQEEVAVDEGLGISSNGSNGTIEEAAGELE